MNPGLPCGRQGPKHLSHHPLPPSVHIAQVGIRRKTKTRTRLCNVESGHPKGRMNTFAKALPLLGDLHGHLKACRRQVVYKDDSKTVRQGLKSKCVCFQA